MKEKIILKRNCTRNKRGKKDYQKKEVRTQNTIRKHDTRKKKEIYRTYRREEGLAGKNIKEKKKKFLKGK